MAQTEENYDQFGYYGGNLASNFIQFLLTYVSFDKLQTSVFDYFDLWLRGHFCAGYWMDSLRLLGCEEDADTRLHYSCRWRNSHFDCRFAVSGFMDLSSLGHGHQVRDRLELPHGVHSQLLSVSNFVCSHGDGAVQHQREVLLRTVTDFRRDGRAYANDSLHSFLHPDPSMPLFPIRAQE